MENSTNIRITKAQRFADIIALLNGENPSNGTDVDTAVAVIEHEIELLSKKNSNNGNRKPTADQIKNESFKEEILEYLGGVDSATCTDILKALPHLNSNQKVSALVRQMKESGKVKYSEVKGRTYISIA